MVAILIDLDVIYFGSREVGLWRSYSCVLGPKNVTRRVRKCKWWPDVEVGVRETGDGFEECLLVAETVEG